ncbi:MAG: 2-succinyl-6-hydroxy-2,4-cyclohexadiene-1-carboxylate synthase [Calditrichia bacterium]
MGAEALHFEILGNPGRPDILFLHGFMGNGSDWQEVCSHLVPDFRCIVVDLPGHGRSADITNSENYSMPETARSVAAVLDQIQIRKSALVGYSMGGRLGLYLALHFVERFNAVILESASPGLLSLKEREARIKQDDSLAGEIEQADFREFLERWYAMPLFRSLRQHADFRKLLIRRLNNHPAGLARSLRYMGTGKQPSLWPELHKNRLPLLMLVGELDDKFKRIGLQMQQICPISRLEIVHGCGHNIHFEKPDVFAAKIRKFLIETEENGHEQRELD